MSRHLAASFEPRAVSAASATSESDYRHVIYRKAAVLTGLLGLVILSFVVDLSTGPARLPLIDVIRALVIPDSVSQQTQVIVTVIRLPVATMAILVGSSLALAGMEMQTILNNQLASPYTLGISSAASFGAALSLIVGPSLLPAAAQSIATPILAFAFALGSSFVIYAIGTVKQDRTTLILSGIAINFLFSALLSALKYFVSDDALRIITNWSEGQIVGVTWPQNLIVLLTLGAVAPFLVRQSWKLTALSLGDSTARSLGVQVDRLRTTVLVLTAVITAVAVCFVGVIGFVGLVAPYIAKRLAGEEQRFYIFATLLTGALMLSVSSILSKSLLPGGNLPLGIVTTIIGIPLLIMLILDTRGGLT